VSQPSAGKLFGQQRVGRDLLNIVSLYRKSLARTRRLLISAGLWIEPSVSWSPLLPPCYADFAPAKAENHPLFFDQQIDV
jgi:hypothetical protein